MIDTASAMSSRLGGKGRIRMTRMSRTPTARPMSPFRSASPIALRLGILKPLDAGAEAAEMSVIAYPGVPLQSADDETRGGRPEPGKVCPVYG